ncbi:MAG: hypothetical protein GY699_09950, partial [Desulfobacteraceae bacterium]|nr:hypothetical protein [Desulfobacteraceae bacterium]
DGIDLSIAAHNLNTNLESECIMPLSIYFGYDLFPTGISGYWDLYNTETGLSEEGPEYIFLLQTKNAISGNWLCEDSEEITGVLNGSSISLSWEEENSTIITITGTVNDDIMDGSFPGGTWWAEKRVDEPVCNLYLDVATQNYNNENYFIGVTLRNVDLSTVSTVNITGPNIDFVWGSDNHYVALISSAPVIGDSYMVHITYTDLSVEQIEYIVDGINTNFSYIMFPADGGVINTSNPLFSWDTVTDIESYGILLKNMDSNTNIWYVDFPSGVNSTNYDSDGKASEPLQYGVMYMLFIHTYDANGNEATTQSTFTIEP